LLLTLLAERQDASGVAIDVSKDALKVAQQNAYNLECTDGVQFIEAGFADFSPNEKANLLISNPPYIETATIEGLEPEVKNHDPHMALDGGADGMIFYKQILDRLSLILLSDSYFLLEIDDVVCDKVMDHAVALGHYNLEIIKDLAGHNRVLKGQCVALTV